MTYYTLRIDERSRQVLLNSLRLVQNAAEEPILSGVYDEEQRIRYEELLQLHRGILYIQPDPEPSTEPVDNPEQ